MVQTRAGAESSACSIVVPDQLTPLGLLRLVVDTTVKKLFHGQYSKFAAELMLSDVTKKIQYQCESLSRNGQWDEPAQAQTVQRVAFTASSRIVMKTAPSHAKWGM